ncbi:Transcription factor IIA, alpha/beta subunit [Fusarium oxysporum f. sp. vasinfectum]|nr:Transcription factor IIA, alpha/beta subunit [Fusarium oxysporum f. sp. vasinfectum]
MSNPAVGNVYQAIIDEVVNSSRVDFEESGVEESVLEELRQQMAAATAQQQQQHPANGQPHIQNGQTDGAGDLEEFEGVLMQRAADGNLHELGRVEIDRMLHEQILAKAKSMEGGGLMLPLKEATRISKCTLKDGVLTVNGKEYVFHKATGEYEW